MQEYRKGDIFQCECEAICNPVNILGISGAGLALAFKKKFPQMYKEYVKACRNKEIKIGVVHCWENSNNEPKYIINFPTKSDLSPSKIEYIRSGLDNLLQVIKDKNIKSIGIPGLGAGLGGLSWGEVKHAIGEFAKNIPDVKVVVYESL